LVLLLWCCCCCMVFVCSDLEIWWRLRGSKLAMIVGAVEKSWERWGKALQRRLGVLNHHHGWEQESSDGFVLLSCCSFQLQVYHLSLSLSLVFSLTFSYNDFLGFSAAAPFIFAFEEREVSIVWAFGFFFSAPKLLVESCSSKKEFADDGGRGELQQ